MIRQPITKSGDIRYFELFKISFLVAFFFALIANILEDITISSMVVHSSSWILIVLYVGQFVILTIQDVLQMLDQVVSYIFETYLQPLKEIHLRRKEILLSQRVFRFQSKRYLQFNVIRC